MGVKLVSSGGGSVEINPPATASNFTATMPAATGSVVLTNVTGNVDINAAGANNLTFSTNTTERARITSSGNLLVGGTNSGGGSEFVVASVTGGVKNGFCALATDTATATALVCRNNSSVAVGAITFTTTATSYNTSSDYRLKENIAPMTGALGVVAQLNPVTYKWKVDGSDGQGFIAHELQAVVPECVTGEKDAVDAEGKPVYQGIDTSFLVATLTAAIQEQQQLITALTARVAALEGQP